MKTYDNRRSPETGFLPLFGWRRDSARRPLRQTGHSSGETCPPGGLQEVTRVLVESNGRPNNPLASAPHIDDICARCGGLLDGFAGQHRSDRHDGVTLHELWGGHRSGHSSKPGQVRPIVGLISVTGLGLIRGMSPALLVAGGTWFIVLAAEAYCRSLLTPQSNAARDRLKEQESWGTVDPALQHTWNRLHQRSIYLNSLVLLAGLCLLGLAIECSS